MHETQELRPCQDLGLAPLLLTGPGKAVNFIHGMRFTVTLLPQRDRKQIQGFKRSPK